MLLNLLTHVNSALILTAMYSSLTLLCVFCCCCVLTSCLGVICWSAGFVEYEVGSQLTRMERLEQSQHVAAYNVGPSAWIHRPIPASRVPNMQSISPAVALSSCCCCKLLYVTLLLLCVSGSS